MKLPVLIALAASLSAQDEILKPRPPSIRVTGEATVNSKPDRATIDIAVVTQAQKAQAAAAENAKQLDTVMTEIRRVTGQSADVKTVSYGLSPEYRYPKPGGQAVIAGFTATNMIEVKTDNLPIVGRLIDVATQSGANRIQKLEFSLKDRTAAHSEALREAAARARAHADAIAAALGVKIVRVLTADEGEPANIRPPVPMQMMARAEAAPPTPIEAGTVETHASVTLTVEVSR